MKLKEIAAHIGVDCDSTLEINGINTLKDAKKDEIAL